MSGLSTIEYNLFARPLRKLYSMTKKGLIWFTDRFERKLTSFFVYFEETRAKAGIEDASQNSRLGMIQRYCDDLMVRVRDYGYCPRISILLPVYKVDVNYLDECLASVVAQAYDNWQLCVCDDASGDTAITDLLHSYQKRFPDKIALTVHSSNRHISAASNSALALADGEYVVLLDHDDRLYPHALAEMVRYINEHDKPDVLYSDERPITEHGELMNEFLAKPDWSPMLHLSVNYTTHLSCYSVNIIKEIGGFREGYEGSQDHDLMLRVVRATSKPVVHVPVFLYQWRVHPQSTAMSIENKPYALVSGEKCVREHCEAIGKPADVETEDVVFHYRVKFQLPETLPKVSIVIPTRDQFHYISKCLESVFSRSTYREFEVIVVDNGTTDSNCLELFKSWEDKEQARFKVVRQDIPFNFARLVNAGVDAASGEYVLLLNNDTEVRTPEWIEELLRYGQFGEIGAVGCKLLYPDEKIQHAGLALMGSYIAGSMYGGCKAHDDRYYNFLHTVREVSAVTAACLLVRKDKYKQVGGFETKQIPNGYGDVDFCLRLADAGYTSIYTPYAQLIHKESPSRHKAIENYEREYMFEKWGSKLLRDPYHSFHFNEATFQLDQRIQRLEMTGRDFREFLKPYRTSISKPS